MTPAWLVVAMLPIKPMMANGSHTNLPLRVFISNTS
jgi:hypothetical protein